MIPKLEPKQYITDDTGQRIAVIVELQWYEELLEAFEELEDIRAYDEAKAVTDEVIPFAVAIKEIEQERA